MTATKNTKSYENGFLCFFVFFVANRPSRMSERWGFKVDTPLALSRHGFVSNAEIAETWRFAERTSRDGLCVSAASAFRQERL